MRNFDDYPTARTNIFDNVLTATKAIKPVEMGGRRLELVDAYYDDKDLDDEGEKYSHNAMAKAVREQQTVGRRLRGSFLMTDLATGQQQTTEKLLAVVPRLNDDGTLMYRGSRYALSNQQRLKPGIYGRVKKNEELESFCFHHRTQVWTENGMIPIGDIVRKRMRVKVWSYDWASNEFVLRPVVGWFRNKIAGLGRAVFDAPSRLPAEFDRFHPNVIWSTPTHKVLQSDGSKVEISGVDKMLMAENSLNEWQQQLVLGSLLGDGHITEGGLFQEGHGLAQEDYLKLKHASLRQLCNQGVVRRTRVSGYGASRKRPQQVCYLSTKACSCFRKLRDEWYDTDGLKRVPLSALQIMDERALAIWFADDGSAVTVSNQNGVTNCVTVCLATCGFDSASVECLQSWLLETWDIESKIGGSDRTGQDLRDMHYTILLHGENAQRLLDLVAPYLPACMHYKLPHRPITGNCEECGTEVDRREKLCLECLYASDRPLHTKSCERFGGYLRLKQMVADGELVTNRQSPGERWDVRMAAAGSLVIEFARNYEVGKQLREVPISFRENEGMHFNSHTVGYDIEVEGTHNYFAAGALVSNCNVAKGTGPTHRYVFNPQNSQFYFNSGNSRIPLVSLLRTLGTSDDEIRAAWGDEIADKNFKAKDSKALPKLFEKLASRDDVKAGGQMSDADKQRAIRAAVERMQLDPWVTKRTTGIESANLTPQMILAATKKVLDMSKGAEEVDDRDALHHQTIHSVEDFLAERIKLDSGFEQRNAFRNALYKNDMNAIPSKMIQKQLEDTIFGSGLAILPENPNPLSSWAITQRITKLGEGGVGSTDAIPKESRDYNASHTGFIDPSLSVESLKIGVDLAVNSRTIKGKDGRMYTPMVNAKTGETEYLSSEQLADKIIAPDRDTDIPGHFSAIRNGQEDWFKKEEVDYFMPDTESSFSGLSNLIPLKLLQPHNRTAMGSRFISQSVPLMQPEAPLVRAAVPGSNGELSFETYYRDKVGVVAAKQPGIVKEVKPDRIVIESQGQDGQPQLKTHWLHEHTSLGAKTAMVSKPIVEVGQQVNADDVLATSNFSDDKGDIAMGVNARMAVMPWRDNFEDAYVVSESFAKRLASHQSYDSRREFNPEALTGKNKFMAALPSQFNKAQLEKLDDHGVVQIGQVVKQGDPILLAANRKSVNLAKPLMRSGHRAYVDASQTWDHENDGIVKAVHKDARGNVHVSIDTSAPAIEGDKIGEAFGSKGVIRVIPDDQMVHDEDGKPYDIVSSDLGFPSRKNSSRAVAMWLGKVAQKLGKPIAIDESDTSEDVIDKAYRLMQENGIKDTETVVDPVSGRKIPNILAGPAFVMKLSHMSESKSQARSVGAYDQNGQPAKGSDDGMQAKRVSNQELGAIMAHGAMSYLHETGAIKGARNEEWVARYSAGKDLPALEVPMVYNKFLGYLKGMGVNPVQTGSVTRLWLMNNDDVDELAGRREVKVADTVNLAKDLSPIRGGLFDPAIFGDGGNKFAKFKLAQSIPHPMMEKPIMKILDVTETKYRDILAGKEQLGSFGTGSTAIGKALESLNVEKEKAEARRKIKTGARTSRDKAIVKLRYLNAIEKHQLKPQELMLDQVPVIPPLYRPISKLDGKGTPLIDGLNHLYQQMMYADNNLKEIRNFSDDDSNERLAAYDTVKAVMGLADPADAELRQKNVKGIMKKLVGSSPKTSYVQGKLLSSTVDNVSRGVALPNSSLKLNQIGVPEEQAWKLFELPVMRRLTRRGIPVAEAKQAIEDRKPIAREAMLAEMEYRPVTSSRAPVLHKYGIQGFMPVLVDGYSIQLNPLVHVGFNLDHDGDQMNLHTVLTDDAVDDVKRKMLPTRMLISPADFESPMYQPRQDHALGLYHASASRSNEKPVVFMSMKDAIIAYRKGTINVNTPIKIVNK